MKNTFTKRLLAPALALGLFFAPAAYAATDAGDALYANGQTTSGDQVQITAAGEDVSTIKHVREVQAEAQAEAQAKIAEKEEKQLEIAKKTRDKDTAQVRAKLDVLENKILSFNLKKIKAKIGTQESTGHTICCPSFSCAYGDAVIDGTYHDHDYYTCSECTWPDWGGGGSSFRNVGSDAKLLREAYDQICAGKPTVIHVSGPAGEHWICLVGYKNVDNPDKLTLKNFIALDPWDGAKITASDRYTLYGDGCEHISSRA